VACAGVLLAQLDTSVVNLAVARLRSSLNANSYELRWFIDAYNLAYAAAILSAGGLGDRLGRRRVFVVGITVFTAGSLACAFAPNAASLIAARALTGLGAALEVPATLALLSVAFPEGELRAKALGVWASMNGLAFAIGPLVGGALTDAFGWRSIFAVAIPLGIATLLIATRVAHMPTRTRQLDLLGQTLAAFALGSFTAAGMDAGVHAAARAAFWAGAGALALAAFVLRECRTSDPLVDLRLFRDHAFVAANAVTTCMTFGMYGMLFLTPLAIQSIYHVGAAKAGIILLPMSVVFFIVSMRSSFFVKMLGKRGTIACGMAGMGIGCLGLTLAIGETPLAVTVPLAIIGLGLGLTTGPVLGYAVERAPRDQAGIASGIANAARMLGATLGVALLGGLGLDADQSALRLALGGAGAVELCGVAVALAGLGA
jgi:EmrB/QacA subfamily drug resistance transporter